MVMNAFCHFLDLEEFQHRKHEVLENLNREDVIADYILTYGQSKTYEEALAIKT